MDVTAKVPANALYKTYHMPGRYDKDFYAADLLSDVLSRGHSSRLYDKLVKQKEVFTSISAFTMGTIDPGLFVISGRVKDGVDLKDAENEVEQVIQEIKTEGPTRDELVKVKNQALSSIEFGDVEVMNRAMNLAFAALSGEPELVNKELDLIQAVTEEDIHQMASRILNEENASVLYYNSER